MTMIREKYGLSAIEDMFTIAKAQNRSAFLPYFPIGYPTYDESIEAITAMAEVGVDGFEIGIPFSDPIADGPVIQAATQISLENGTTVKKCLEAVRTIRTKGVTQPMLMMGYVNPLIAYGLEKFVQDAREAGADGLIIPDLPAEEAGMFTEICAREGMALVFFLAPTSNEKRIKMSAEHATGFIYVVSLIGITGARNELPDNLTEFVARLRSHTDKPLVMGFGISTPAHARTVGELMDGFIVGSALVRAGKDGVPAVRELAKTLRDALDT